VVLFQEAQEGLAYLKLWSKTMVLFAEIIDWGGLVSRSSRRVGLPKIMVKNHGVISRNIRWIRIGLNFFLVYFTIIPVIKAKIVIISKRVIINLCHPFDSSYGYTAHYQQ